MFQCNLVKKNLVQKDFFSLDYTETWLLARAADVHALAQEALRRFTLCR